MRPVCPTNLDPGTLPDVLHRLPLGWAQFEVRRNSRGDPDTFLFQDVNPAFETLSGALKENLAGNTLSAAFPGEKDAEVKLLQIFDGVAGSGEGSSDSVHFPVMDRWFSITAFAPTQTQVVAVFSDISDQKKAEKELRAKEERLSVLFEFAPDVGGDWCRPGPG